MASAVASLSSTPVMGVKWSNGVCVTVCVCVCVCLSLSLIVSVGPSCISCVRGSGASHSVTTGELARNLDLLDDHMSRRVGTKTLLSPKDLPQKILQLSKRSGGYGGYSHSHVLR